MLAAVWVHYDFKLLLWSALKLHAEGQINESAYQPERLELNISDDKFQEKSERQPFLNFGTRVKNNVYFVYI